LLANNFLTRSGGAELSFRTRPPASRLKVNRIYFSHSQQRSGVGCRSRINRKSLEQAISILKQTGLNRGFLTQIHTPQYPAGRIIAQYPPAGAVLERNSAIGFLVSQGEREKTYLMPDLIGRKVERAVPRLQAAGFKVEDIRHVYYPGLEKGVIVRQNPPGGYPIQKRNPINLEVSR